MAESVYVPSTLKEGYFADLPAPVAGDDARPITYNHATLSYVYSSAFATAAQVSTVAGNLNTHANLTNGAHGISTFGASLVDDADQATARGTLGLVIGTNIQAYNANLAALAGLTGAADKLGYFTGVGALALADFTTVGRNVVAATTQALARTALGLGTMAVEAASAYPALATINTFALAQTFTSGIIGPIWKPASNTTTALKFQDASGAVDIATIDTSNNRFLIGASATHSAGRFDVGTEGASQTVAFSVYSNTASHEPLFYFRRGRGTFASPLPVQSGDVIGSVRWAGQFQNTLGFYNTGAKIDAVADGTWANGDNPIYMRFFTTAAGSGTAAERLRITPPGLLDFRAAMANSAKVPGTDAPIDWVEIKINGTAGFIPVYAA